MADEDLPYTAEYAKSGRSNCKVCKNTIVKDVLRLGIMIQSPHFDGKIPIWYHQECFFKKIRPKSTGDIKHFLSLRYEDQEKLKKKVAGSVEPSTSKGKGKKKNAGPQQISNPKMSEFYIEYAGSSRSSCKICSEKIPKGEMRISKLDTESDSAKRYGPCPGWHHVDCFVKMRNVLGFQDGGEMLPNFPSLSEEDQEEIKKKIKGSTKRKIPDVEEIIPAKVPKTKEVKAEEKALKEQSKLFYEFRDALQANLKKKEYIDLLEINGQAVPSGESQLLDLLADCLCFGPLNPCPECKGQLRFGADSYKCGGSISGWTMCQHKTKTPDRRRFKVPEEYKEKYDFLAKYKHVKRQRIFPKNVEAPSTSSSNSKQPLDSFKVFILGDLKRGNDEATKIITELGGKIVKKLDKNVTCVITNEVEAEKFKAKVEAAEKKKTFVISEEFLNDVKGGNVMQLLHEHKLYDWGDDDIIDNLGKNSKANGSKSKFTSKAMKSNIQKVTVEGKVAVDPDAQLSNAHVLEKGKDIYNAVLGLVDIQRGTNSYYKLQVLKSNYSENYHLFRSWGRVGTSIGNTKLERFTTAIEAIMKFKELYLEKTDNDWDDREDFVKAPNRFYPLDIDYGQEAMQKMKELKPEATSMLVQPIQQLICMIFDVESMKKTMLEFEIDMQKMPLGKISKKQIQSAYSILTAVQEVLKMPNNNLKILDESNKFYTLIPHDFGMRNPPLLDNESIIQRKTQMLESLLEIEVAYSMLQQDLVGGQSNLDQHYKQLKTDMEVLDRFGDEFRDIEKYLRTTHAETHGQYSLKIEDVFKINRHGETEKYNEFTKNIPNKKLLWHGSRTTNYVGILSQGLRIAPPEAPVTGYMFGKGLYFADMVSKSANYCYTSSSNPTGLLLLCEVALGEMLELKQSSFIQKLPQGKDSTKGLGQTTPNPAGSVFKDGVEIPMGKPMKNNKLDSALLYNEYIIYDINQVNIKYLLKVQFNYKYK